jgi:hypothetical protein
MEGKQRGRYSEGAGRQVGKEGGRESREAGGREEGIAKRGRAARGCTQSSRSFETGRLVRQRLETQTSTEFFATEFTIACAFQKVYKLLSPFSVIILCSEGSK